MRSAAHTVSRGGRSATAGTRAVRPPRVQRRRHAGSAPSPSRSATSSRGGGPRTLGGPGSAGARGGATARGGPAGHTLAERTA
eukprot:3185512-Alexandrium_andersonii.AAC.1